MSDVPRPDTIAFGPKRGLVLTTSRKAPYPAHVAWSLDPGALPSAATVAWLDVRVCGHGSGDFYELYGPDGTDPVEYEMKPPAPDGCWHFAGAPADFDVQIYANGDSTMTVDRVEMVVTTRP